MDGGENRQTNMDVILAVVRRSRREPTARSAGATEPEFRGTAKGTGNSVAPATDYALRRKSCGLLRFAAASRCAR